ncbi:MAG: hypothetical protein JNL53_08345 [Cyclobacteriaceae bacterium]|nr:hypothetical protein [Cyclobacteriaceae bacterium]
MKIKNLFLLAFLALGHNLCFGQNNPSKNEIKQEFNTAMDSIFYVLQVDDKSLEFDPRKNEKLDLEALDPNSIESLSVLKGNDAMIKYGAKGHSGVIIITFKNFDMISKDLQIKFLESNR